MTVMKKDVNIGLLILIVATLIMFSGFTVYYQTTFKNISQNYNKKLDELNQITKELEVKRGMLNETSLQLKLKKQKEEDLNVKYTDLRNERDQLENTKTKLELELTQTKTELADTKSELAKKVSELSARKVELADAYTQISDLKGDVIGLKNDITKLKNRIGCLQSKPDAEESSC